MKASLGSAALLISASLVGCTGEPGVEDGETDVFLTDDAKADAFGVEDWSPDGAAVLKLASTSSAAKLEDEVGLSARVAKSIVAHRAMLAGAAYKDLSDLDDASYVGITVFRRLLAYATEHKLFKTALRIPLVVEGNDSVSITSFNDKARAAGLTTFARYTFVDASTDYGKKMDSYDARLQELAMKANITIDGEMKRYASTVSEYAVGSLEPCFIGDPLEVPDVTSSQGDSLMGDMYSLWGWRYKAKKWVYDDGDEADYSFTDEWKTWNKSSASILLESTNTDGGDQPEADIIEPCRR